MKKYAKVIVVAIVIGGILAFLFYRDINEEVKAITKKDDIVYLFQVGVFKNQDNALNMAKTFDAAYIYNNDGYFRVIIAVAYQEETLMKLEAFFNSQEIDFFIKEQKMNKKFIEELTAYEKVLIKSEKETVINSINKNILNIFSSYINEN